jgi:hypothetical protein
MAINIEDDLQLGKLSKLLGAILEQGDTATINAALTALGQIGYDTTLLRAKVHNGTTQGILLERGDIDNDSAFAAPSTTTVPSTQAMVTYIGNLLAGGTRIRGQVTLTAASTYPVATAASYTNGTQTGNGSGTANAIKAGDAWYVGNAASFQMGPTSGKLVEQGDLVIALTDGATNIDANWLVLDADTNNATTTTAGLIILSTLAQIRTNAGGDADKAVTVSTLNSFLASPEAGDANAIYSKKTVITQTLNSGANTVTHNKGTQNLQVMFINATTNAHTVMGWTASTTNAITVNRVGGSQSFRIVINY